MQQPYPKCMLCQLLWGMIIHLSVTYLTLLAMPITAVFLEWNG
jgi:hypothetical protein